jgi:hypothetical protein
MSLAKILAVNSVLLTTVVVRSLPFHCTTEPETKSVPVTVSVKAGPTAVAVDGERDVTVGKFPLRLTVCGLPPASSVMVRLPVRDPVTEGVKVTSMVQVVAEGTVPPE